MQPMCPPRTPPRPRPSLRLAAGRAREAPGGVAPGGAPCSARRHPGARGALETTDPADTPTLLTPA